MQPNQIVDKTTWIAVKDYYNAFQELPEAERELYLNKLENENPKSAAILRNILKEESDDHTVFDHPAISKIKESEKPNELDLIGTQIDKYKLKYLIGVGGMGKVYLADRTDLEAHQQVAVKIISAGFLNDIYQKRFDRERKILSRLNHPHITRIYDGGIADNGMPYIIMEFVEGKPLLEYAAEHELSLEKRVELFLDLCSAVDYAHRNFIMHRDLKPGNILVTNHGIIKVIDFGIAKILEENESDDDLTVMGYIPLTPAYASPEQLKGQPLTVASDLYSLGVILYELLTGNKPFPGSTKSNSALTQRFYRMPPSKPSTHLAAHLPGDLKVWRKNLHGDLDNIILKALKEEPAERYSSVDQLAVDIRRYQKNYPVLAQPDSLRYRAKKYFQRNRSLVSLALVLVLAIIGGIATTLWQARIASIQRDQAQHEAAKAHEITEFVTGLFDYSDPDRLPGEVITAEYMLAKGSDQLIELESQPALQAEMYRVIGNLYKKQDLYAEAETHLLKALALFSSIFGEESVEAARTKVILSELYSFTREPDKSIAMGREAAAVLRHQSGISKRDYVKALNYLARGETMKGNYVVALEIITEAAETMNRISGSDKEMSVTRASLFSDMATAYNGLNNSELFIRYTLKAKHELINAYGEINQNVAAIYNNIGHGYYFEDQMDSAAYFSQKALDIANEIYGDKPNGRAQFAYCSLAKTQIAQEKYVEALANAYSCYEMAQSLHGEVHMQAARGLAIIGDVYLAMNDYLNAEKYRQESMVMMEVLYDRPSMMMAWHYWDQADRYFQMKKFDRAAHYQEKSLELYSQLMPEAVDEIAECKSLIAKFLFAAQKNVEAVVYLRESFEDYKTALGAEHETTQLTLHQLIDYYNAHGMGHEVTQLQAQLIDSEMPASGTDF